MATAKGGGNAPDRQKTIKIGDTEYTFQRVPMRAWLEMKDNCKNQHGVVLESKLTAEILKHIVVEPRLTIDDFENEAELVEVASTAISFQQGRS